MKAKSLLLAGVALIAFETASAQKKDKKAEVVYGPQTEAEYAADPNNIPVMLRPVEKKGLLGRVWDGTKKVAKKGKDVAVDVATKPLDEVIKGKDTTETAKKEKKKEAKKPTALETGIQIFGKKK